MNVNAAEELQFFKGLVLKAKKNNEIAHKL